MSTEPSRLERTPPPLVLVRLALAGRRSRLHAAVPPMAQANAAAAACGSRIGCLKGEKFAVGLVDDADGHVVAIAVCASPSAADLVDPHTLEVRCLLADPSRAVSITELWSVLELKAGERGYCHLVMRGTRVRPPLHAAAGWPV